ncbi:Hsp70 family protein, partial [Streptomyces sp. B1866]|uniref:Hsp70 family protein n=1 Tax=Streptomyces sp. B1866 TaxID=3075431 RepID=UPI00288E519F
MLINDSRERLPRRAGHVLAVDFGTSTTCAVLVRADGRDRLVKDPLSGSWRWPSAVFLDGDRLLFGAAAHARRQRDPARYLREFKRLLGAEEPVRLGPAAFSCTALVARLLAELRRTAEAALPAGERVTRAVATVPAGYQPDDPRWTAMLDACADAGFADVELLPEPVAAALGADAAPPPGTPATVLVYDFGGGTFDAALLRYGGGPGPGGGPEVLGHAALDTCGGRDIDGALTRWLRETRGAWLDPLLAAPDGAGLGHTLALGDFARRLKHQLSGVTEVEDRFLPGLPAVRVTREDLERLAGDALARTVDCCRDLLRRCGVGPGEVGRVLMAGGSCRMPAVRAALAGLLRRPVTPLDDPDLAVALGAARWAADAAARGLPADPAG